MNIFEEYLEDWEELDPHWRPVVERLARRTDQAGIEGGRFEDCAVCAIWSRREGEDAWMGKPMLIWCDLPRQTGGGGITLGAVFRGASVICGTLNGHCPDDLRGADLSWASYETAEGESVEVLGDFFADWFLDQMHLPVETLEERRSAVALASQHRSRIEPETKRGPTTASEPTWRKWARARSRRAS